jgi:hypothetical protein
VVALATVSGTANPCLTAADSSSVRARHPRLQR